MCSWKLNQNKTTTSVHVVIKTSIPLHFCRKNLRSFVFKHLELGYAGINQEDRRHIRKVPAFPISQSIERKIFTYLLSMIVWIEDIKRSFSQHHTMLCQLFIMHLQRSSIVHWFWSNQFIYISYGIYSKSSMTRS